MKMKNEMASAIRVGVAGLGRSGWNNHALPINALPELYSLVAVADPNLERCREAVEKFGCRTHADLAALLADPEVDLVVLATPSQLHCEQTLLALAAGKDVVCEKPMASSVEEVDRMIEAARRTGRMLTVFQDKRYLPSFMQLRKILESGVLGRIVQVRIAVHGFGRRWDWQTLKEFSGGELNNTGSHFIDQLLLLLGSVEPEVFCHMERTLTSGDAEDHVKVILRAPEAPLLELEISKTSPWPQSFWHVMGTCGGLTGSPEELKWKYVDFSRMPERRVDPRPTPDRSYNAETYDWSEEQWHLPQGQPGTQYCFYEDLGRTLREGLPPPVTPESVRRQIALLDRCRQLCPVFAAISPRSAP